MSENLTIECCVFSRSYKDIWTNNLILLNIGINVYKFHASLAVKEI